MVIFCHPIPFRQKIALASLQFLLPQHQKQEPKCLLLTREVLELGALLSIKAKDSDSFERYLSQLDTYYFDLPQGVLPMSQRMYMLMGLYLSCLLSQNRISEFHTYLERIQPEQLEQNLYVKHAVRLEQCLMEGAYNRVWQCKKDAPAEEYHFFMDILTTTMRDEIAVSAEKAYVSLPLPDATSLFFCKDTTEFTNYAQKRGWNVNVSEKKVYFAHGQAQTQLIPSDTSIRNLLHYAWGYGAR